LADSLRAFAVDMGATLRALDIDGVIRLYGDTTQFVHVDNGVVIPWRELSRMMREFFRTAKSNPVDVIGEPGVTLIDRNTAAVYVSHRFGATAHGPAHEGVWTGVLKRGPNGWRIMHSHSSDKRP
jgi:ketosteroid isomerase-like protein